MEFQFEHFSRVFVRLCAGILFSALILAGALTSKGQNPTPTPVISVPGRKETVPPAILPNDPPPVAPNFQSPTRPFPSSERVGVDVANQLPLTLEEAIQRALRNNNDIDVSRNDNKIAEFNLKALRGVYDPLFASEGYYENASTPTASLIGGAVNGSVTQTRYFGSAGLLGNTPKFGGSYTARLDTSRTTTSNTNAFLNPQFPSVLNFTYTQPLLRNFRIDNNRRLIEISKRNITISDSQFKQRTIETITAVGQAYWDLAYALRNLQVQIDAVKQARAQLESNQRQVDKGVLAPIEVVAATAQITTIEQSVFAAQEEVTRHENTLKSLMLAERTDAEWTRSLTPVSPIALEPPRVGLEMAVAQALKNRPEIEQLEESAAINKVDLEYFRNQTKPEINLVGSYTSQGLSGVPTARASDSNGNLLVPLNLVGGFGKSLVNLLQQDYPTYRISVTIGLPLGNTTAKANLGRAMVETNRIGNLRAQAEQVIEAEVRNSIQALRSAEARLSSSAAARDAAEKLAESEERQFRAGTTTFYLVLQRQTELIAARGRELQAQTDLNKAISEYNRATGSTLSANNISIADIR
ncbi:MAG: TolC family protein [Blastocatellia bacterium]